MPYEEIKTTMIKEWDNYGPGNKYTMAATDPGHSTVAFFDGSYNNLTIMRWHNSVKIELVTPEQLAHPVLLNLYHDIVRQKDGDFHSWIWEQFAEALGFSQVDITYMNKIDLIREKLEETKAEYERILEIRLEVAQESEEVDEDFVNEIQSVLTPPELELIN